MEGLLTFLTEALAQSLLVAFIGAFLWGMSSILLSPCHLASIPLLIGFLTSREDAERSRGFQLSLVFSLGILLSITAIGAATASAGRLLGDLGRTGNAAVALVFFLFGFYLMDLLPLNWNGPAVPARFHGNVGAFVFGSVFGIGLGPCTFAFMAPVLGVVFTRAETSLVSSIGLLGAFAIGHCGVIVLAGTLTQQVEKYLRWTQTSRAMQWVRRTCGFLVVLGGVELLRRAVV